MAKHRHDKAAGDLVTRTPELTLADLCRRCELSERHILSYVSEGIIEPQGKNSGEWRFSRTHLIEIRRARRLERDLGLNAAGAALALELMDRIRKLEKRLEFYEKNPKTRVTDL